MGMGEDTAERFSQTAGMIGGIIGAVVSLVLTVRAFMVGGLGYGLVWIVLIDPIVLTISYWAMILITLPLTLAIHAGTKGRRPRD